MKELTINCLCRVCLKNSHLHKNIYEGNSLDEFLVYELVNDVCDLGISVDDGLPEFLCAECFTKIIEFKTFKTNAHKGRSTFLLLKERVEYPIIKQEELEISGDESEEQVDVSNTKPIFGPILLKDEMLTVYNDMHEQDVIDSEILLGEDAVEPPDMYMEDSTQNADHCNSGSELREKGAVREDSSDDDMEPLTLEQEDTDDDSKGILFTLLDAGTRPQYLQCLQNITPPCESEVTADAGSCFGIISADDESVSETSKNNSLVVECETSSNGKMKTSGQCIHRGELGHVAPSLQENFGNGKEREEKGTGDGKEGLTAPASQKKLEGKKESLECHHCGKMFMSKHYLIQHMKFHGFDNSCDCEICINVSQTKVNHKCNDLTQTCSKLYKCAECSKGFSQRDTLKAHIRSHTGAKPYKCAECSKRFRQSDGLKVHMRLHTGSKPYKCAECNKCFRQKANLNTHLRLHTGSKPYKCLECNKSFRQSGHLEVHMRSHTRSKPYKCAECNKCFSQSESLKTHLRLHTGAKPYVCSECSKSFSQSANLKTHMRLHTGEKPYKCADCSRCFSQNGHLQAHRRIHTGLKPYTCAECSTSFSQSASLIVHMRTHTGSKPYKCPECSKCFRHSVNLKSHLRSHTGLKPYKCANCNKSYTHSSNLKKHMRIHRSKTI